MREADTGARTASPTYIPGRFKQLAGGGSCMQYEMVESKSSLIPSTGIPRQPPG